MLRWTLACAALLSGLSALPARAQSQADTASGQADPPTVVGRIAEVTGGVSYKGAASADWANAERNWPVVAGDAIYAAADGQAKLEVGQAFLTVFANGEIDFVTLSDRSIAMRADLGSVEIQIPVGGDPYAITTPRGAASVGPDGLYKVTAGDDTAPTEIIVCRGAASLANGQTRLGQGQMARLTGDQAAPRIDVSPAPPCGAAPVQAELPPPRVSRRMTGVRELAGRGRWASAPAYGDVWYPRDTPSGWAPYKHGHWKWVAPWGWTWIDDASWGFAPFHYGKWAEIEGQWGWVPGEYAESPVYSPAMVAFVDLPPDGYPDPDGVLTWVPLGPGELFHPYYYSGIDYMRRVNIIVPGVTAITIAAMIAAPIRFAALRNSRAVLAAPLAAVRQARPMAQSTVPIRPNVLANTQVRPAGTTPAGRGTGPVPNTGGRPVAIPPQSRLGPMRPATGGMQGPAPTRPVATAPPPPGPGPRPPVTTPPANTPPGPARVPGPVATPTGPRGPVTATPAAPVVRPATPQVVARPTQVARPVVSRPVAVRTRPVPQRARVVQQTRRAPARQMVRAAPRVQRAAPRARPQAVRAAPVRRAAPSGGKRRR